MSGWKSTKDGRHFQTGAKPGISSDHSSNSGTQPSSLHQPIHRPSKLSDQLATKVIQEKKYTVKQGKKDKSLEIFEFKIGNTYYKYVGDFGDMDNMSKFHKVVSKEFEELLRIQKRNFKIKEKQEKEELIRQFKIENNLEAAN